jgi:hypothetical protein
MNQLITDHPPSVAANEHSQTKRVTDERGQIDERMRRLVRRLGELVGRALATDAHTASADHPIAK